MPTLVKQLFTDSGKEILGQVKWGQKITCNFPGIYVVTLTHSAEKNIYLNDAPISKKIVQEWISYVPKLTLDGKQPKEEDLINRLKEFWIQDETIVYIGKAGTSLKDRVNQYYRTKLGDPKPHRGGTLDKNLK